MNLKDDEHLKFLIDNAPIGICILDANALKVEILNSKFLEIAGRPKEAILEKCYWDAFPEMQQQYQNALNSVMVTGEAYHADEAEIMLFRDGREDCVFVTFVFAPVKNASGEITKIAIWVLENTQQVKSRQEVIDLNKKLAESNDRLKAMTQASPVALLVTRGENMIFEEFNQAVLNMVGKDESIKGKPWFEAIPELKGQAVLNDLYHTYRTGEALQLEEVPIKMNRNGKLHHGFYSIKYTPLIENGEVTGVLQSVIDVTAEINARREVDQLNEELSAANEEIVSSNEELASTNEELAASNEELTAIQTALQQLNETLTDSDKRFRRLLQESPVAIFVLNGRDMVFETVNDLMYRMLGKGPEIIGKPYAVAVPELVGQPFFDILDQVFLTGETFYGYEIKGTLNIDGKPTEGYFNFTYQAIKDSAGRVTGIICVAVDVVGQVKAREEVELLNLKLEFSNEGLRSANVLQSAANKELLAVNQQLVLSQEEVLLAIDAAGFATWEFDPVNHTFSSNELLKEWFGLQPEDHIELATATAFIADQDRERVHRSIAHALTYESGGDYDIYYTIIHPQTQTPRIVRAKGKTQFNEQRQPVRMNGILQDVTELKQDEQRKNDFIGMVSHELKTPLTSLTAYIQMLQGRAQKAEDTFTLGALDQSVKQVKRMSTMINGFLNVSRLESGKININRQLFDMAELVKESEAETIPMYSLHQIEFAPVEKTMVMADREKIGQVINNFISNAVKYSRPGSTIKVAYITADHCAVVSVKDQGIGIEKQELGKLFDRYYRVEANNNISGFGIGLYLCKEIIDRHQGKIWVESDPEKGSTFFFSIPTEVVK